MKFFIYILFTLIGINSLPAQRIVNFNVSLVPPQVQGGIPQVLVRFGISPGIACPGYELLHSLDSINFIQFYNYAGICGTSSIEETYSQLHSTPAFNQINYYKVSIPGFETSSTARIFVGEYTQGARLLLFPNPIINDNILRLKFLNFSGNEVEGYIYNQSGIKEGELYLKVVNNLSEINIGYLPDGLYIIWLTDGNIVLRSKFIIKRP